jgi:hypothetical protein
VREENGLNQPAVGWRRVTIAKSILAAKVQESSGARFTFYDMIAIGGCGVQRLQAKEQAPGAAPQNRFQTRT